MSAVGNGPLQRMMGRGEPVLWAMIVGGVLWIVHGYYRNLTPHGPDVQWQEELGYSPVLSPELFLLYNVPGVLALLLTAWAALSFVGFLSGPRSRLKQAALVFAVLGLVLGIIAAAGQVILFDPLTFGGISFGIPVLGLALFLAGLAVARDGRSGGGYPGVLGPGLMLMGAVGMFVLPLRPLMYALELLPLAFGAGVFAVFGGGWVALAVILRNVPEPKAGSAYA